MNIVILIILAILVFFLLWNKDKQNIEFYSGIWPLNYVKSLKWPSYKYDRIKQRRDKGQIRSDGAYF